MQQFNLVEELGGVVVGCAFINRTYRIRRSRTIGNYPIRTLMILMHILDAILFDPILVEKILTILVNIII